MVAVARTQAMRQGKLNSLANATGNMISTFHQFYMAMFYEFYDAWVTRDATIAEMHYVMEAVERVCRKDPAAAIAKYAAVLVLVQPYPVHVFPLEPGSSKPCRSRWPRHPTSRLPASRDSCCVLFFIV